MRRSRFPTGRSSAVSTRFMAATSSPLAVAAALEVHAAGGSAVDAAIAADAVLGVVQPMSTGLGGDLFALVEADGGLLGYNGSGASPAGFVEPVGAMPARGGTAVTVPGHVDGWEALHRRFGRVDLAAILRPAIRLAADGFPVGTVTSARWVASAAALGEGRGTAAIFLVDGRAPMPGQRIANPAQAGALTEIAAGARGFYEGRLAEAIVAAAQASGSALSLSDMAEHRGEWVAPLFGSFAGWQIAELPPNGQGAVVLGALSILDGDPTDLVSARRVHRQAEALKLAFTEASTCIGDPRHGGHAGRLVDEEWASGHRVAPADRATAPPPEALPGPGGTVYVAVADGEMTVSLISSNFMPFGSAVAVPEGGFVLQNRGGCFRALAPVGHPNRAGPGRRPYHTIIPALVRRPGAERFGALGVVGGDFQPQGHVQVVHHLAAGLDSQAALDAPRFRWLGGHHLSLETGLQSLAPELRARGHGLVPPEQTTFGGAQLVLEEGGFLYGAGDGRQDSLAAGM